MVPNTSLHAVLDLAEFDLAVGAADLVITAHAVQRYRERVERVPRWLAMRRIRTLAATASWRWRPLPWTQIVIRSGVIYGYGAVRPDVCLLVRDDAVVTVMSRRALGAPPLAIPIQRTTRDRAR
jgi:hypothetical protein